MKKLLFIPLALLPLFLIRKKDTMQLPEYPDNYPDDETPDEEPTRPEGMRACVVSTAMSELGTDRWQKYCDGETAVMPSKRVAWCGIFALWVLHQCGLGKDFMWQYGKGFAYRLPRTTDPKPGDIAYIDQPLQHHAIVKSVNGNMVYTIDGNQAGDKVAERVRLKKDITAFYSIQPLIEGNILT